MKHQLHTLFTQAVKQLQEKGVIPADFPIAVRLERSRDPKYGDFACNNALTLAKAAKMSPRDLATQLVELLPTVDFVAKVEIAGPGFINVFLTPQSYYAVLDEVLATKDHYGHSQLGAGQKVMVEFVSANPTGPLHVGHGRGAAYGAALSNLLTVAGFKVHREYYVNDAGRQMDILATSIWLRYLELCGPKLPFPSKGYKGDYIWDIADSLHREYNYALQRNNDEIFNHITPDVLTPLNDAEKDQQEKHMDDLIAQAKQLLGDVSYRHVFRQGLETILQDIRQDLEQFGVVYDNWFYESSLMNEGTVKRAVEQLKARGHTYEQEGALWFKSTAFGDKQDRVVIRENGQYTYFASDIAYHLNKLERGFDHIINVWGADHHGYVPRIKAVMTALGANADCLTVLLVQFAILYRGRERVQMSTRSGEFVTLRELRQEVGQDAARFFYVHLKSEQHLDFDLDLAKKHSNDNPVYYIQYAYARLSSLFREARERNLAWQHHSAYIPQLTTPHEQAVLVMLARYPEVIETAAQEYEPHQLTHYLLELAQNFHSFYDKHKILLADEALRNARMSLSAAVQQVLRNGLQIIGVSAPEVM